MLPQAAIHLLHILSAGNLLGSLCLVLRCQARRRRTGTHTVIVTVEDDDGDTDSQSFTLTVSTAAVGLTLVDFVVPSGHELVTSALIEAGAADFIYRDDDPTAVETSDSGEILDGDLEPATGYRMSLVTAS